MGKTAAIYNPYLNTLGGGERYMLTFAKVLAEDGYTVDIEWSDPEILTKLFDRFGFKLNSNIKIVESVNRGENYDLCFWVSDGSIPTMRASKNLIHFQVPFHDVNGRSLLNKMKMFRVDDVICNSNFTKKVVDLEYGINSKVLYPPIDLLSFKPMRKENIILYVGRFSNLMQSKRQDVLIDAFKNLYDNGIKNWKLILAGGIEVGDDNVVVKLNKLKENYPIEIIKSPSFDVLKSLFGKAKIFWSASGFEVDEKIDPQKVEHFGMTVVEAMSAGVAPVVLNSGGHKEIIQDGINGLLWESIDDLVNKTTELIKTNGRLTKLSKDAVLTSKRFGFNEFKKEVLQILK